MILLLGTSDSLEMHNITGYYLHDFSASLIKYYFRILFFSLAHGLKR